MERQIITKNEINGMGFLQDKFTGKVGIHYQPDIRLYLTNFRILVLDNDNSGAQAIEKILHNIRIQYTIRLVNNKLDYINALNHFNPDMVYCDFRLKGFDAIGAVRVLRLLERNVPFIMVNDVLSENFSATCLNEGITDFLVKDDHKRLPLSVVNALRRKKNEDEIRESNKRLHKSFTDLKQNTERFRQAQQIANVGNWELNFGTGRGAWSEEACRMYGIPVEERMNQTFDTWLAFVHPQDLPFVLKEVEASHRNFKDSSFEHRILLRDGTVKHIHSVAKFEFDQNGKPVGLFGICRDITKQKQTEQKLRESQEIADSIQYAKNIQESMLPSAEWMQKALPEHFVFHRPKNIVSGDFYWAERSCDHLLFAVVDCTGHGVPGAFVSIVCNNALNRAVTEFGLTDPAEILNKVSGFIEQAFGRSGNQVNDGMDIALCSLDTKTMKLRYAGANNPLFIVRKGELTKIKANKQPVGRYFDRKPFDCHHLQLEPDDTLYVFSDGYADQFGGREQKKFKIAQLRQLLLRIQDLNMAEQKEALSERLKQWMGDNEQVDDICIMGVRIPCEAVVRTTTP